MLFRRALKASLVFGLLNACGGDRGQSDAGENAPSAAAEAARPSHEEDAVAEPNEDDGGDASQPSAKLDGALPAAEDAALSDSKDGARDDDAGAPDASAPYSCALDAGAPAADCMAYLCQYDGGTALALRSEAGWRVGALGWYASVCEHGLGWARAMTSDTRVLLYTPSSSELRELTAGAPVRIAYANPDGSSAVPAERCTLVPRERMQACPETPTPLIRPRL